MLFTEEQELRNWFERNYKRKKELYISYYKEQTAKRGISFSQSVAQALCFGWCGGGRKSLDKDHYVVRFTPRMVNSRWSEAHIRKVEELLEKGLMKYEGIMIFNKRKECGQITVAEHSVKK